MVGLVLRRLPNRIFVYNFKYQPPASSKLENLPIGNGCKVKQKLFDERDSLGQRDFHNLQNLPGGAASYAQRSNDPVNQKAEQK